LLKPLFERSAATIAIVGRPNGVHNFLDSPVGSVQS
jgi:hypothetical protein